MNDNERGRQEKDALALAQAVKSLRENLPASLEYAGIQAKVWRAKYLALVREGFTEKDALELCWKM
jgi:hypothetical protein